MAFQSALDSAQQIISGDKKIIFNAGYEAANAYAEPNSSIAPKIQLLFSPYGLPFIPIEILGTNINKIINNFKWTKDRNNPGGILQFTLSPDRKLIDDIVKVLNTISNNLYSMIWGELGVDLEDLFKPMTLCQLWIDGYHVMTGTVRSCVRNVSVSNTEKEVNYDILIEELGNIYNMSTISLDTILQDGMQTQISDSISKALSVTSKMKGVPISVGVQAYLTAFTTTTLAEKITMSDGFPLALRLQAQPNPIGGLANSSLNSFMTVDANLFKLNSVGTLQSMWSFLKGFIPNPWMEFFCESGGRTIVTDGLGVPSVLFPGICYPVARTTPYSNPMLGTVNPKYLALTSLFDLNVLNMIVGGDFVIITDDIIMNKSLGHDSVNQATVFSTKYTNKGMSDSGDLRSKGIKSVGPLNPFASGGIPSFGIREMIQNIDCTSLIGLGSGVSYVDRILKNLQGSPGSVMTKSHFSNLLANWFRNQSRFREGTVTIKGMPYARAGMYCLYLPSLSGKKVENLRDIGIYYIDQLSHDYNVENEDLGFTTTLNLIRGVPLPTSVAQTALLLFDYEIIPPMSGVADNEYTILKDLRNAASKV